MTSPNRKDKLPNLDYVTGICPSGKRSFYSRAGAKRLVRKLKAEGDKGVRTYRCPDCDYFHAGHMPDAVRLGELTIDQCYRERPTG